MISKEKPVLDIGAGQGRHTQYLSECGYSVEAIDTSTTAIRQLNDIKDRDKLDYSTFVSDFQNFAPGGKYSTILVFGLIQILSWEEIALLIKKLSTWLDKDGLVFITAFTTEDDSYKVIAGQSKVVGKNSYLKPDGEVRTFLEPGELKELFNNFESVHYKEYTGPYHHHGDNELQRHEIAEGVFRIR